MTLLFDGNPRLLWVRYMVGLAVLLATIGSIHVLNLRTLEAGIEDAEVINISGRQRMLSQRIAYAIDLLSQNPDSQEQLMIVEGALTLFSDAHLWLLERLNDDQRLINLYNPGAHAGLDHASRLFAETAQSAVRDLQNGLHTGAAVDELRREAMGPLLVNLNGAVQLFEQVAKERTAALQRTEHWALGLAFLIVLFEAAAIFWPAQVTVNRSLGALETSNQKVLAANNKLNQQLHTDLLTGLLNRYGFENEVKHLQAIANFDTHSLVVFVIDLDGFKPINDRLGHASGDLILRHVGRQLLSLRGTASSYSDSIFGARMGGDEFMVCALVANSDREEAARSLGGLIISQIAMPVQLKETMHQTRCSVGYAFIRSSNEEIDRALIDADLALLQAKAAGKGCAASFEPHIRKSFEDRSRIINDFDDAVDRGEFEAFFQPQVNLKDGGLVGFEALARWRHPELGLLLPGQFLEPLTKSRRAHVLDLAVLRSGLSLAQSLRMDGWNLPPISFNASAETLRSPQFMQKLQQLMLEFGTQADQIKFEVLETVLIEEADDVALETLSQLQSIGIRVELDDFGGGYSSLALIGLFPFDGVKVDKSIVQRLDNPRFAAIAKAISLLGRDLGLSWTAEGLEKPDDFSTLRRLGVERGQGFIIARPIAPLQLPEWLDSYGARPDATGITSMDMRRLNADDRVTG